MKAGIFALLLLFGLSAHAQMVRYATGIKSNNKSTHSPDALNHKNTLGQDLFDEISAYKAQYAFNPSIVTDISSSIGIKRISDITTDWLQNITIGGNQPYKIGNENNTGISPININSGYDEIVKAYPVLINSIDRTKSLKDYMYKYKSL
ncbi:MAG: hypothetical protein HDT06_03655 [Bacteroidales bacterium]|nr:hypothetical protein [Bacteroidales bacterium]